jgi:uncharacterized protein YdhG (YjbR/CyaY superfamily)
MARRSTKPDDAAEATAWIDAYLAALPTDQRTALQSLRETIAVAAPEAVETVSYGLPAFRYRGKVLVWYHAAKTHCSFFPRAAVIDAHRAELAGYGLSKGTIRFTPDHPLPKDLVATLVQEVMAQTNAGVTRKK